MKRVIICAVMLALAISAAAYARYRVERLDGEVTAHIEAFGPMLLSEDCEALAARAAEFASFWDREEDVLVHFVRHSHIDLITTSVARLPSLAAYGEFSEFSAELACIRNHMEHIRNTEELSLSNIF